VKRALAWFAGLVGIAALGRWLARRRRPAAAPPAAEPAPTTAGAEPEADDPAAELRRKLAAARETGTDEPTAAEPDGEQGGETLEERRARIHAKARAAIDAMADDGTP
jgi:hypothetical protein